MNKKVFFYATVLAVMGMLNGCAEDKQAALGGASNAPTPIVNSLQGVQAGSAIAQAQSFAEGSAKLFTLFGRFATDAMNLSAQGTVSTIACTDGGVVDFTGYYDITTGAYSLTLSFGKSDKSSPCRQDGYQLVGSASAFGDTSSMVIEVGASGAEFSILNFNSDYSVLLAFLKTTSLAFTMDGGGVSTDAAYTIVPSGTITVFDYFQLGKCDLQFSNLTLQYVLVTDTVTGNQTETVTVNGKISELWTLSSHRLTFTNFTTTKAKSYDSASTSFYADDRSVAGSVAFNYSPNSFCFEGLFDVVTLVPVHSDYATARVTQGTLLINNATQVQYSTTVNANVAVVTTGDSALLYATNYLFMKQCDYYGMEQETPPLLGPTGTAVGNTFTVTLSWLGGATSDMDLHVKYYTSPNPTSLSTEAWRVDWNQGATCTMSRGITFTDAIDFDGGGTGTCDVGLDFDDTEGYGPEHITALKLATGYYVVSVNSFSLDQDPDATVFLAITAGDYLFGPYSTQFTTSDGNGTDPTSWYRVADIRVNSNGTIEVLGPNMNLNPWKDP